MLPNDRLAGEAYTVKARASSRTPKLPPLKLGCAEHQSRHHSQIHLFHRIVELRLYDLRIVKLPQQRLHGSGSGLPAQEYSHGPIESRLGVAARIAAQQRGDIAARAAHFVTRQSQ